MLTSRGIIRPLHNGEVVLFSITSAAYLYLFRKKDELPKSISSALKYVVGSAEAPPELNANDVKNTKTKSAKLKPEFLRLLLGRLQQTPKHRLCQHHHGCLHYVLQGFCRQFGLGYVIQTVVKFLSHLPKIPFQPSILLHIFFNKDSLSLGAFLGCYSAIFKAVNCVLRWFRDRDDSVHGLVAGFLAGWSMMMYKSSVIALYAATKLGELLYFKGIKAGVLPYIKCADIVIYSISTAFAFHAAVLEPHNLRPAYWKFLLRVTGNRFAQMNRRLVDVFGTNASKLYPDYWPNYDMRFTSLNPLDFS
ncbi:transmembrane protein 135-like [Gigantopelta aegis]|uniref:transmembrane protein 135-like n=1 Tax=Gigantopelta aegis TaxID=1735272 RepID=UPI001B88D0E0|nr:transmembrane protein 135-like [Gigantopelta aegis]